MESVKLNMPLQAHEKDNEKRLDMEMELELLKDVQVND